MRSKKNKKQKTKNKSKVNVYNFSIVFGAEIKATTLVKTNKKVSYMYIISS